VHWVVTNLFQISWFNATERAPWMLTMGCGSCAAASATWIEPARELPGNEMPVAEGDKLLGVLRGRSHGHFAVRVCDGCSAVDWFAGEVDFPRVAEAGLAELWSRPSSDNGPYR